MINRPRVAVPGFQSYAHNDADLVLRLRRYMDPHLKISTRYDFNVWRDTDILPGEDWDEKIRAGMAQADLCLFMVTPDLLASRYVATVEIPELLTPSHAAVPVLLRHCDYKRQNLRGLEKLQIFSLDGKAFLDCATSRLQDLFAATLCARIEDRMDAVRNAS